MKNIMYVKNPDNQQLAQSIKLFAENGYTVTVSRKGSVKYKIVITKDEEEEKNE